jgi:hypothetical protein
LISSSTKPSEQDSNWGPRPASEETKHKELKYSCHQYEHLVVLKKGPLTKDILFWSFACKQIALHATIFHYKMRGG